MKIINYKKKKNNIYEITLSNSEKINLYDDVILKYNLLLIKEIKEDKLKDILKDNNYLESYYIALKFINTKLRTEKEIRKKLINYNKDIIDYVINRLKKDGYINDLLYIKSYINDEINLKIIGPNKIIYDLKNMGFNNNDILNYLNTFKEEVWLEKIRKIINKKINSNHNLSAYNLKQKIYQDLLNKGFLKEHINIIINEYDFIDNTDIYNREYNKIKNKLSKKYNGKELDYRINIALLNKGFKKNSD